MEHVAAWLSLASLRLISAGLIPLDTPGATPEPSVYPEQGNGFAAYIVGGFLGLGILILFMIWTSRRPKRPS
jgi:hypothetical protein